MELDAGANTRQVSQQPRVVEVVALARLDGGMRGAVRDGALQRVELAQCGDQLLALRRGLGQGHRGLTQQEGRHEKVGTPRCAARSQIEATIAPFLCDQQWGDRGDQGCFRPQTIGTGGRPDWACRERTYKSPGRVSIIAFFECFEYDRLCNRFRLGATHDHRHCPIQDDPSRRGRG